jgi:hypothetical protein
MGKRADHESSGQASYLKMVKYRYLSIVEPIHGFFNSRQETAFFMSGHSAQPACEIMNKWKA